MRSTWYESNGMLFCADAIAIVNIDGTSLWHTHDVDGGAAPMTAYNCMSVSVVLQFVQ